mmetsp:Transcript_32887/g.82470  ORF Transcript_32887/g.82470 Transcript_32887/m.82470 type:complete len:214 (-) Transcript_32887:556-1197(-)
MQPPLVRARQAAGGPGRSGELGAVHEAQLLRGLVQRHGGAADGALALGGVGVVGPEEHGDLGLAARALALQDLGAVDLGDVGDADHQGGGEGADKDHKGQQGEVTGQQDVRKLPDERARAKGQRRQGSVHQQQRLDIQGQLVAGLAQRAAGALHAHVDAELDHVLLHVLVLLGVQQLLALGVQQQGHHVCALAAGVDPLRLDLLLELVVLFVI